LIAFLHSDVDVEKYILEAELKFQKYNEERKKRGFLN
jgi:hypothetical protein